MAAGTPFNAWVLRILFIILTVITLGGAALLYLALWWLLPQESLIADRRRGGALETLLALVVIGVSVGVWVAGQLDALAGPGGGSLFLPVMLVVLSAVFFLRQVRG